MLLGPPVGKGMGIRAGQNRTSLIFHCLNPRGMFYETRCSSARLAVWMRWLFQGAHLY